MDEHEILLAMALTCCKKLSQSAALRLYRTKLSAQAVYDARHDIRQLDSEASPQMVEAMKNWDEALQRAQREWDFAQTHHIQILPLAAPAYPDRLRQCADAPLVLYYKGSADLNATHTVAVVGTRHITEYGKKMCEHICTDLAAALPEALVVSGLAYGVDIHAHRAALTQKLPTVGVLAHGLDTLYPPRHADTARQMVNQGGLLTEYMSAAFIGKENFVRRNRIVAGMCDATIVVESAQKGGALITARLAQDYGREVFACPGRIGDEYSTGCNNLIYSNRAGIYLGIQELMDCMNWKAAKRENQKPMQRELFPELNADEQQIFKQLDGNEIKDMNRLIAETKLSIQQISTAVFTLEMKGLIKSMPGNAYRRV